MSYRLGVDIGTTFSSAAVARDGRAQIVTLGQRAAAVPTAVWMDADGSYVVGDAALRRGIADPSRLAREFKRRVGDSTPVLVGGSPIGPERLMARVLAWVVGEVARVEGGPPSAITVTHPANWGPFRIELLHQAVEAAEVDRVRYLTEPEAAAIYYALSERIEPGELLAVYDLGGGTFDATMLRKTADGFEIVGEPGGIEHLGGVDFDEAVFAHVRQALGETLDGLDQSDPAVRRALARLREECVDAKEALSVDADTTVPVLLPGYQGEVRVTRAEFEGWIRGPVRETIDVLHRTMRSAGVAPADVSRVLLVGGSSRIPLVAELVRSEVGRPVAVDAHPKHAVALGAALAVPPEKAAAGPAGTPRASSTAPAEQTQESGPSLAGGEGVEARVAEEADAGASLREGPVERRGRRPVLLLAGAAVVAAVVVAVAVITMSGGGDGSTPSETSAPDGVGEFPIDVGVLPPGHVPVNAGMLTDGAGFLWVKDPARDRVRRYDRVSLEPVGEVETGAAPFDMLFDGSTLFVTNSGSDTVDVIDLESLEPVTSLTAGDAPLVIRAFEEAPGRAFVANSGSATVSVIDLAGRSVAQTVDTGETPVDALVAGGNLFVANYGGDSVSVFALDTLTELPGSPVAVGDGPVGLAEAGGKVWAISFDGDSVTALDAATGTPAGFPVTVGDGPVVATAIQDASLGEHLVVLDLLGGTATIVNPGTLAVEDTVALGGNPVDLGHREDPAGYIADATGRVLRLDLSQVPVDPATAVTVLEDGLGTMVKVRVGSDLVRAADADGDALGVALE